MSGIFLQVILLSMSIGIALVCAGLVVRECITRKSWPSHAVALIYFFLIIIVEAGDVLSHSFPESSRGDWISGVTMLVVPSLGACIWFYVRGLTSKEDCFGLRDLWHLVPVALCAISTLPFWVLSEGQRALFMTSQAEMLKPQNFLVIAGFLVAWAIWIAILILYGGGSLRRLIINRGRVRELYSSVGDVSLTWLHGLILIVAVFTTLVFVSSVLPVVDGDDLLSQNGIALFYFGVVLVVGLFGVSQTNTIPVWSQLEEKNQSERRYARSALQTSDLARIAQKLDLTMQSNRLWQNPNLSLMDISKNTGASQNNISQTLNEYLGVNFYDYVNGWRVKAACEALRSTDQSVLSISEEVGFNAKSTFNAAFKKITGQTPSAYRLAAAESSKGVIPPKFRGVRK